MFEQNAASIVVSYQTHVHPKGDGGGGLPVYLRRGVPVYQEGVGGYLYTQREKGRVGGVNFIPRERKRDQA